LSAGQDLGEDLVDTGAEPEIRGDGFGDRPGVSGDHDDLLDALAPQLVDRLPRLGPDFVFQGERGEHRGPVREPHQI